MRVEERRVGPCTLRMLKADTESVVSWHGSFVTNPDVAAGQKNLQALAVALLDKGTRQRDRFALAEALESCGARAGFASEGVRVSLEGRSLEDDVPHVLAVLAEMLTSPLFAEEECAKERVKLAAGIEQDRESTSAQAMGALRRCLFERQSLHFQPDAAELLSWLENVETDQVRDYHARNFGSRDMTLAFAGDFDTGAITGAVQECFGAWPGHAGPPSHLAKAAPTTPGRVHVHIPEKTSLDVRLGHALALDRQHDSYMPLLVAIHVLGGNFSARLMRKVRDEMGLTYGVYSRLAGFAPGVHGFWVVGVTLSRENLRRGMEATLAQVRRFVEEGPSAEELRRSKDTICGAYKVGLATSGHLAGALHGHLIHGLPPEYLRTFPAEIDRVTLEEVRKAVQMHLDPDALHVATAGDAGKSDEIVLA